MQGRGKAGGEGGRGNGDVEVGGVAEGEPVGGGRGVVSEVIGGRGDDVEVIGRVRGGEERGEDVRGFRGERIANETNVE